MENQHSQLDTLRRIEGLAASFPVLAGVPGVAEWNPMDLEDWVMCGLATNSQKLAVRFLLTVWNPDVQPACGRFDVMEALVTWDEASRHAN